MIGRGRRARAERGLAVAAVVLGVALGGSPAVAQDGSLEDALGDRLEVRRDGSRGGADAGEPDDGGAGGGGEPDEAAGGGVDGSTGGADGDGIRDLDGAGDAGADGATSTDGVPDGPDAATSDADGDEGVVDLDEPTREVEGEGRGPGELAAGGEGRAVPLTIAAVALLASAGALVAVQRRYGPTAS